MQVTCDRCGAPVASAESAPGTCAYCGSDLVIVAEAVVASPEHPSGVKRLRDQLEQLRADWEADSRAYMVLDAAGNLIPPTKERQGFQFAATFGMIGFLGFFAGPLLGLVLLGVPGAVLGVVLGFLLFFAFPMTGVAIDGHYDRIWKAKYDGYERRKQEYNDAKERLLQNL